MVGEEDKIIKGKMENIRWKFIRGFWKVDLDVVERLKSVVGIK